MNQTYNIQVNDVHDFQLSAADLVQLDAVSDSAGVFHLLQNHQSYNIKISQEDFLNKKYEVEVNGNSYQIQIHDQLDNLIKELGFEISSEAKVNDIYSPMPGLILDILVNEGDQVVANQPLLILEAMKMENIITAPRDGKIKKIIAQKAKAIEKKALLINLE
ncbi:MAG: acetyl-CoA carboxylase biotin carboxyl carrier protein subunit [Flavobacteriaceae bacterium]|nr:acetyl-CoA carboxylase biotin carboxyl carrier protein subunit [Flavobacteriaceae bacterium]